jgi:hypothetical protein
MVGTIPSFPHSASVKDACVYHMVLSTPRYTKHAGFLLSAVGEAGSKQETTKEEDEDCLVPRFCVVTENLKGWLPR